MIVTRYCVTVEAHINPRNGHGPRQRLYNSLSLSIAMMGLDLFLRHTTELKIGLNCDKSVTRIRYLTNKRLSGIAKSLMFIGARGRTRTGTIFRSTDFKSVASTNSATRATGFTKTRIMEARTGIEPTYTELQSAA